MREILVIRFGSLGDLCLLGWTLSRLAEVPGRVTLVTKAAFAGLARQFTGVDRVVALPRPDTVGLLEVASQLRSVPWDTVLDAHAILRGNLLLLLLGRRPQARLRKDTRARLRLLRGAAPTAALARTMRDRFDAVLAPVIAAYPELADVPASAPLAKLAETARATEAVRSGGSGREALGLAPGAMWETKRWPAESFAEMVTAFRRQSSAPVRVFLGPREDAWFDGSALARALAAVPGVVIWRGRPLVEVATALAGCRAVVSNDSGLMHLAEAVGTPVVACFGPTVRAFGYFPTLPESRVLEVPDLECRPCSRNGKRPCWRGDLACLVRIPAAAAVDALEKFGPWLPATTETP